MTSANRVQLAIVPETTFGTTPGTPRMLKQRVTSIGLTRTAAYVDAEELRDDRMNADPVLVGESNAGQIGIEWHYPKQQSALWYVIRSAFCNAWVTTPTFDNDGTADSVITDAGTTTDTYVVASGGASVVAGHLVRATGFTNSANNQTFRAASSTGTTIVGSSISLTAETAPPATARLKVIGFQGASGDITATATGLGSTALDFTTLGLAVGQWVKIGGTGAGNRFATEACNVWGRVTAIAATALTLDNLPVTWTTDAGTSKTVKVFFGDYIKNGTTKFGLTMERGFLGQTTPAYIAQAGMRVNTLDFGGQAKQKATGSISFMGMQGTTSTTALDASPDDAPTIADYPIMAFSANCGRVGYGGSALGTPNWASSIRFSINNNLREIVAVSNGDATAPAPVDVQDGSCDVSVELDTYFGSNSILADIMAGTVRGVNTRLVKGSQAMVWEAPRLTPREGEPNVSGRNTDVMIPVRLTASKDTLTAAHLLLNALEYVEA